MMDGKAVKPRDELCEIIMKINKDFGFSSMHLELASDSRAEELRDFLIDHFYPDETICKSLSIIIDDVARAILLKRYSQNLSLLLISNESDKIIGCRTIVVSMLPEMEEMVRTIDQIPTRKIRTAISFLHQKDKEMDVFKRYGVDVAARFINLCTHKDYRSMGLGTKMMGAALSFVKQMGLEHPCVTGEATSEASQRVYEKFDFELLHTFKYEDYEEDGKKVFKNTGKNTTCKIFVKQL